MIYIYVCACVYKSHLSHIKVVKSLVTQSVGDNSLYFQQRYLGFKFPSTL